MTELVSTTPGLYPLPEWAKDELADLKGHQKGDLLSGDESEAIVEQYDEVRAEYVDGAISHAVPAHDLAAGWAVVLTVIAVFLALATRLAKERAED